MDISKKLRLLAEKKNIKQVELADYLGVAKTTINGYFRGTSEPDLNTIKKLSHYFKVSIDYLLDSEEQKSDRKETFNENDYKPLIQTLNLYTLPDNEIKIIIRLVDIMIKEKDPLKL